MGLVIPTHAQDTPTTLTAALQQVLDRESNGHSPTDEDIAATQTLHPTPEDVKAAVPVLTKVLASPDAPARTYALTAVASLESAVLQTSAQATTSPTPDSANVPQSPAPPQTQTATTEAQLAGAPPTPTGPAIFPAAIAQALTPAIPALATRLTDDVPANRTLAANILGGFSPNPPAAVYPPLLAFLKREDAPGPVGQAVVADLLQLGTLTPEIADAIAKFLHRSDQDENTRSNLVDAIGSAPNQSQTLNKSMLSFLSSDDPSLRARVILTLPQLDLAPDVFADTRTRVAQLVDNTSENLQVVTAARAVTPCWTATKMITGCPVY